MSAWRAQLAGEEKSLGDRCALQEREALLGMKALQPGRCRGAPLGLTTLFSRKSA